VFAFPADPLRIFPQSNSACRDEECGKSSSINWFLRAREAWLAWQSKVAPFIAAELGVEADVVVALLSEHVYEQFRELGGPQGIFNFDNYLHKFRLWLIAVDFRPVVTWCDPIQG
jgi:hypothetical protein